ncbi:MAG: DUF4330 domain-containing protein [Defluviitaleaceae bacterium]|nr:DUF4330 domain-containing protein [Defluviitaleaceae bacterium]
MIDNQGKIRGRVSIIDIILILVVVTLAVGFLYRRATPHITEILRADTPFYVTFEVNRIRSIIAEDTVIIGDRVFRQHAARQALGTIVAVDRVPATDVMQRADGTALLAPMEGRYSLRITIEASGNIGDAGFIVNGNDHLATGSEVAIINNRFIFPLATVYYIGTERP